MESKYRHEKTNAASTSTQTSVASPLLIGVTTNEMPSATPERGVQPPNQYTIGSNLLKCINAPQMTPTAVVVAIASRSANRRGMILFSPARKAATTSGIATGNGMSDVPFISAAQLLQTIGIERARTLVGLDHERQQQSHDGSFNDDIGEHQRLNNGIDRRRTHLDVGEDRGHRTGAISD